MRRTSLARLSWLLVLCAPACAPAEKAPVASADVAVARAPGAVFQDVRSPRLGVELALPLHATAGKESSKPNRGEDGTIVSRIHRLDIAWPDGGELSITRSDDERRTAVAVADEYLVALQKAFSKLEQDDTREVAGRKSTALVGLIEDKIGDLRVFAVGRSVYTILIVGTKASAAVVHAERILASVRLSPAHGLHVAPGGAYTVALPDTASSVVLKDDDEDDGASVQTFAIDPNVPNVLMVLTMALPDEVLKGDEDGMFQHAVAAMASQGAQFGRLRAIDVDGMPGRDIEWSKRGPAGTLHFRTRALLVKGTMYMAMAGGHDRALLDAPDAQLFLDSFRPAR